MRKIPYLLIDAGYGCKKSIKHFLFTGLLCTCSYWLAAQDKGGFNTDTLKPGYNSKKVFIDTAAMPASLSGMVNQIQLQNKLDNLNPQNLLNNYKSTITNQFNQAKSSLLGKVPKFKAQAFSANILLEEKVQYQPTYIVPTVDVGRKWVNVVNIGANLQVWGLPLQFNYSTSKNFINRLSPYSSYGDLFKIDFDYKQFVNSFSSDLQKYVDLSKDAFAGLSLTAYTQKMALEQINNRQQSLVQSASSQVLVSYLKNPENVQHLLTANKKQIEERLQNVLKATPYSNILHDALNDKFLQQSITSGLIDKYQLPIAQLRAVSIAKSESLNQYLGSKSNLAELANLSEQERIAKLRQVFYKGLTDSLNLQAEQNYNPVSTQVNFLSVVKNLTSNQQQTDQLIFKQLSETVTSNPQISSLNISSPLGLSNVRGLSANVYEADTSSLAAIKELTSSITQLQKQLTSNGSDITKLIQIQNYLDKKGTNASLSELESSFYTKAPKNTLQHVFSALSAFKFGAFGSQIPGSTQGSDLFTKGTSVSFKSVGFPVTLGYGKINDLNALKDAEYQTSVYNRPRDLTYISTVVRKAGYGPVKISIISSFTGQAYTNTYYVPAISSNNITFTVNKSIQTDNAGTFSFDVSKSNTLFNNKYQLGSEAILQRKDGIRPDLSTDLFQSLALGLNHHLDIQEINMSDNAYISYSGMGYQNPGNNGFGGARLKFGGNLKKAFYENKLVLNIRSDFNNQPISYTSNDRWKTYQIQLDSRYTINKNFNVGVRYSNNATDKRIANVNTPVYGFEKYQFDGNANYKIGKNYSVSHLTLAMQSFSNTYASQAGSSTALLNYTQSVLLNKNALTLNVFYNKELAAYHIIGDMLNSDLTYQYSFLSKLNLSTGLTYLNNTGIAKQVGVRQSLQLLNARKFDVSTYIDVRENLITPLYKDLYASCRAELSIRYHLNY
ncbi:hypothetical protein GCM10027037_26870 [Mucilaginibacter koreensis]